MTESFYDMINLSINAAILVIAIIGILKYIAPPELMELKIHCTKCAFDLMYISPLIYAPDAERINNVTNPIISKYFEAANKLEDLHAAFACKYQIKFDFIQNRTIMNNDIAEIIFEMRNILVKVAFLHRKTIDQYIVDTQNKPLELKIPIELIREFNIAYNKFIRYTEIKRMDNEF